MIKIASFTKGVWYAQEVLHSTLTFLTKNGCIGVSTKHTTRMLKEWGIDIGFTYMPKFTHRESLTPEPPNLIGAMEPHIPHTTETLYASPLIHIIVFLLIYHNPHAIRTLCNIFLVVLLPLQLYHYL